MYEIERQQGRRRSAEVGFGISFTALVLWVLAGSMDDAGALWLVIGFLGLAGAVLEWRARREGPRGLAIAALVVGGLLFAAVAVFSTAVVLGRIGPSRRTSAALLLTSPSVAT